MDKNTIYGLILMALVFLGFMWLQPKPETVDAGRETTTAESATRPNATGYDALSATETDWLRKNLAANGDVKTLDDGRRVYTHTDATFALTLDGDSIYGTVRDAAGAEHSYASLFGPDHAGLSEAAQRELVEKLRSMSTSMGRFGKFTRFLSGDNREITLDNDVLALTINTRSGSITKAELKKYDSEYSADESKKVRNKVVIFNDSTNTFNFTLPLAQAIETKDLYFTPRQVNDSTLVMALEFAPDTYWGIEYTLPRGDNYVIGMRIVQHNMDKVVETNNRILTFDWHQQIKRQEQGRMFEERNSGIFYKFAGGSVENLSESKNDSEERQAKVKWIAFKNQFFSSVMIADKNFNNADLDSKVIKNSDYLKDVTAHATVNDYDWTSASPVGFNLYIGPNLYPLLSHLDKQISPDEDLNLTRLIPLGWTLFRWINVGVVIPVFSFLGKYIHNYGIIILLLTIFIKLVLFPLTFKSYKSQAKMRILAPDIQKINEKYPGQENAMTRQQKTMALYSKAGANPMSGCLPTLLQMPILFAMFTFFPSAIELRGQSFLWAHDLSAPDAIVSWSTYIPLITPYFGNHISLFCLLMTAVNIIYTYINMQNSPGQMPGMKWMMYLMPLFFLVFFNNYAAGLSYYYFLSLLITIMQTYAFRYFIKEDSVRKAMAEAAKKPKKKSGFMARIEEMQRQQQQMLKEQQKRQGKR
ncbi:MAG: membrane protein insertase YidC [Muribaculaceae bacterium]|nr:membrane protein insertase YidC [Muribaculaceae bacterium]